MTPELRAALDRIAGTQMTAAEFHEQRISFAYGNAPAEDTGTKDDVRRAIELGLPREGLGG